MKGHGIMRGYNKSTSTAEDVQMVKKGKGVVVIRRGTTVRDRMYVQAQG